MKDLIIKAFQTHPMFEGISLTNCETLMHCLGCTEKAYNKEQIIPTAGIYARQIGIVVGSLTPQIPKRLIKPYFFSQI